MRWADYSAGRPAAAALLAAGFGGVIRYVGLGSAGKRITAAEYQGLVAAGLRVLLVAELDTADAWEAVDDYAAGRQHAAAALADARALGIPDSVGIAAAADAHASGSQITDAVAYCRGFADVLGQARTGFYGFPETLTAVRATGVASWFWRCGTPPSTAEQAWTHLWQRNDGTTTVAGVAVDITEQYLPIGDDVSFTDVIGHRKDGTPITAGDALANLYLGAYYGGGDAGAHAAFPAASAALDAMNGLPDKLATSLAPAVATAIQNAAEAGQITVNVDAEAIATSVIADIVAGLNTAVQGKAVAS